MEVYTHKHTIINRPYHNVIYSYYVYDEFYDRSDRAPPYTNTETLIEGGGGSVRGRVRAYRYALCVIQLYIYTLRNKSYNYICTR